jgi:hypothetical protein
VPKSRVRRQAAYTAPPVRSPRKRRSPRWLAPLMVALFLVGIAWLVVYYIGAGSTPGMSALGDWNLAIGFGFIIVGFALSTQWR